MTDSRSRQHVVEYANLTVKFGDKDLLDYAEEIFLPVFFDESYIRSLKDGTQYLFIGSQIIQIVEDGNTYTCIATRFFKKTRLVSEQRLEGRTVVRDDVSVETSPSSFLAIILETHKVVLIHETKNAPSTQALENTLKILVRRRRSRYIRELKASLREEGEKTTIPELEKLIGKLSIDVIPLSNKDNLETFLRQFQELNTIEVKLVKPNTERLLGSFFAEAEAARKEINSETTTVRHHNKTGLEKEVAINQLESVVEQGNAKIKFEGKKADGSIVEGDNDKYKIRTLISNLPKRIASLTELAVRLFSGVADHAADPRLKDENILRKTNGINLRKKA